MNTEQALAVLDICTTPANAGKLSRDDYANCSVALRVLAEALKPAPATKPEKTKDKTD